jgi:hypothetical protein
MARYNGTAGNDAVAGAQNERDAFIGFGAGNDKVVGGQLNDTFVLTVDEKTDYVDGGNGEDQIDYSQSDRGLAIDLAHGSVVASFGGGSALVAKVSNIEDVVGSKFNDKIMGTDDNNTIEGGVGADYINGGMGTDTARYFNSAAGVEINLNNVVQHGGEAEGDQLYSIENVIGSAFNDVFTGNSDNNYFDGHLGFDRVVYANATEGISFSLSAGTVTGGASTGVDTLRNIESIQGSNFADTYDATGTPAGLVGGGGPGYQDALHPFNEFEGMGGNDLIIGNGNTRISYVSATSGVLVDIAGHTAIGDASVGTDTFTGVSNVRGSNFADTLIGSDNAPLTTEKFDGHGGNDYIDGQGGFDLAIYDNDPTTTSGINVALAAGTVHGDATVGTDTLRSVEAIRGTDFADTYNAVGFDASSTNAGSVGALNQFEGMGGDDTIFGNGNTRLVFFNATAGVTVDIGFGRASGDASVGHDTFQGVNAVSGSDFADKITAGHQDNILTGGGGGDTFAFGIFGHDTITDFTAGDAANHDVIYFTQFHPNLDFAGLQAVSQQVGSDVVITIDPTETITLTGVDLHALTAADFHFT